MCEPGQNPADQPTQEELREAERKGVLRWKETQDILHIKKTFPTGCACELCKAVRTLFEERTTESPNASPLVTRRVDLLAKLREGSEPPGSDR
jgi:hypothetical protein